MPKNHNSTLHDLLDFAVQSRASDIHMRENKEVQLRIDSNLVQVDTVTTTEILAKFCEDIVPTGRMEIYDRTGDLDFAWQEPNVGRFRVNLHKQRGNMGITMRWVKSKPPTVAEAGLPEVLKRIADNSNGIIFITGTTGSGKSTTMAAMLDYINSTYNRHVITIEDPIEYTFEDKHSFFEQREVGLDAETFESALVHALRQDPDIIVVGEMRNRVTFETALAAAETGHMVITTLHTKDAPQSINRILDMFTIEERDSIRKSLSDVVKAIICQRLAKKASGKGVVPITEIMTNAPIVKKLIFDNRIDKLEQAIEANQEAGMMTFNQCLLEHYNNGDISEEKALELSDNPQALRMNFKGIFLTDSGGIIQ
ncbi:MAG: PilT/PilU family type 4a pilus ATPase [Victivallales bacterium]|nr:PilT/PilU family type 4a pilus ATPase [Victivallales bacterium]